MCGFVEGALRKTLDDKRLDGALERLQHRGYERRWCADGRPFISVMTERATKAERCRVLGAVACRYRPRSLLN